jgi:hypothetical protein
MIYRGFENEFESVLFSQSRNSGVTYLGRSISAEVGFSGPYFNARSLAYVVVFASASSHRSRRGGFHSPQSCAGTDLKGDQNSHCARWKMKLTLLRLAKRGGREQAGVSKRPCIEKTRLLARESEVKWLNSTTRFHTSPSWGGIEFE